MSTIIALDLIKSSMRLFGGNGAGITPSSEEANDALAVLNDVIEAWTIDNLATYGSTNVVLATLAGVAQYTMGPGGQLNTDLPDDLLGAFCTYGGVDFPIDIIGQDDYNLIPLKTQQQPIVERLCYINSYPLGTVLMWPTPQFVIPISFMFPRVLTSVPNVNTLMAFPRGYLKAFRYALAIELAAEYGTSCSPDVHTIATKVKSDIMRLNRPKLTMKTDPVLTTDGDAVIWQRGY